MRVVNKKATSAVIRNLSALTGSDVWTEAWQCMDRSSIENFQAEAVRYLSDKSELRKATLEAADWNEVYAHFQDNG
jgi:hypothetical protein